MDTELEATLPLRIKSVLQELIKIGIIGLSRMKKLRVTTNNNNVSKNNGHSFILEVPYAGTYLNWEVIFSNEDLKFAPDFDFINDQFLTDPDIDVIEKHLPSLHHWDIDDAKSLHNVTKEILQLYKKYQVDRLQMNKYHRQFMEYMVLTGEMCVPEEHVEVLVDQSDCVHFLIVLPIDISILPPYMGKYFDNSTAAEMSNPGANTITLRVSYMNPNKTQTCVWLSPNLEEIIGSTKQLHIPSYNKDMGLLEYVPSVRKLIRERLETISANYKMRNQFVSTMLAYQGGSIVEYDSVTFSKMTLLLEAQENHCLVLIHLGKQFDKPTLQLRSLYCERNSKPLSEHLSYPYHPDASVEEIVRKMLHAVYAFLTNYKLVESNNTSSTETSLSYAGVVKV